MTKKGGQIKAIILLLYLLSTPILVNSIVNISEGIVRDKEYAYYDTDIVQVHLNIRNSTGFDDGRQQSYIFDNNTKELSIPGLDLVVLESMESIVLRYIINISDVVDSDIYKIVVELTYVGSGNITEMSLWYGDVLNTIMVDVGSNYYYVFDTVTGSSLLLTKITNPPENATIKKELETFEALKLATRKYFQVNVIYTDLQYMPSPGDFLAIAVKFYKKDMIITKEQLIQGVLVFLAITNFIIALFITALLDVKDLKRVIS